MAIEAEEKRESVHRVKLDGASAWGLESRQLESYGELPCSQLRTLAPWTPVRPSHIQVQMTGPRPSVSPSAEE